MDEQTLEPCPFCGNAAVGPSFAYESGRWDVWQVECGFCDISIETPGHLAGDEARVAVVDRWNHRAAHSVIAGKVAELTEAMRSIDALDSRSDDVNDLFDDALAIARAALAPYPERR